MLLHIDKHNTYEEAYIRYNTNIKRRSLVARGTDSHNPRCQRRTDVGTHDNGDGLCQCEQSCIDKRHGHHCRCR